MGKRERRRGLIITDSAWPKYSCESDGVGLLVRSAVVWDCMGVGGAGLYVMIWQRVAVWSVVIWQGRVYYGQW